MSSASLPSVAIIGRPNVGKSALFNRVLRRPQALVDETPGLTRDRLCAEVEWRGVRFRIMDTGGLEFARHSPLGKGIAAQATRAVQEAALALLVCDAKAGLTALDEQVSVWVRRWGKPVMLVANKVDLPKERLGIYEFSALGWGAPWPVSCLHGRGVGELLDAVVEQVRAGRNLEGQGARGKGQGRPSLPNGSLSTFEPRASSSRYEAMPCIRVAIVGRPNVGKSSLINRLLNEERVLVDASPGTTRDPVEVAFSAEGRSYRLIDTAGVRARRKTAAGMEKVARLKSLETIRQTDVCLGVLEAPAGFLKDDLKLLDEVITAGKPLCLALNKWDLLSEPADEKTATQAVYRRAPFLRGVPVVCTSAKSGFQVLKALKVLTEVALRAGRRMTAAEGRRWLEKIRQDPKAPVGVRNAHFIRIAQVGLAPPTFRLLMRGRRELKDSDLAFLKRSLQAARTLEGIPLRLQLLIKKRT